MKPKAVAYAGDRETCKLLEIIAWVLTKYFSHNIESAYGTVEKYYQSHKHILDDDHYHHDGPYWMALRIHYIEDLGNPGDLNDWMFDNNYRQTPHEVIEYFRKHYFTNNSGMN